MPLSTINSNSITSVSNTAISGTITGTQLGVGIIGQVSFFAFSSVPSGWIKANGAAISRTTYAALFAAISTTYGVGDGTTTFNVPDLRGYFPRGWVDNGSVDSGRSFGSTQTDAMQGHKHSMDNSGPFGTPYPAGGLDSSNGGASFQSASVGNPSTDGSNGAPRTASETRPSNVALLACIKF
jgi:microcystin-dependent protein